MTKVTKQKMIFRKDLQDNPSVLYLFGDNSKRVGLGGQAGQMRGEPNAIGVATKREPTSWDYAFFYDTDLIEFSKSVDEDLLPVFSHLNHGGSIVIPSDGLGTGLSELPTRAPQCYEYLTKQLNLLEKIGE
jgi:hypothetical protein